MRSSTDFSSVHYHKTLDGPVVFTDGVGVKWLVHEISAPSIPERLSLLLPHSERRGGWLLFESQDGERRRLAPYPPDWRSLTPFVLERWCMRATRVHGDEHRRRTDDRRG